jgi:protein tyrosine/serine phosphatase
MKVAGDKKRRSRRLAGWILAVCLVGGGVWFWDGVVKDRVIPKRWAVVEEGRIYRSGQLSAALVKKMLQRHGIQVIVSLNGAAPQDRDQQAEQKAAEELGVELLRFPLRGDGTGDVGHYTQAVAAVAEARRQGKPVLVHCAAGAQRTGGVIACYQLLLEHLPPAEVVAEMRQHGWDPRDNPALLKYLNQNLGEIATRLREQGVIEEIPDPLPVLSASP